ncbi:hypothetical protein [Flavilitoribacter nigricans]|uniref:hypothetical protein n=1 Tax=Flavilitoribacter nigricans TaxID=70997 RepID=UPI00147354CA|nr:hypothetical protein [Flavilitoribacter nigricans]
MKSTLFLTFTILLCFSLGSVEMVQQFSFPTLMLSANSLALMVCTLLGILH